MTDFLISKLSTQLIDRLSARSFKLATAESCTGGLISAAITDVAGSSSVFTHGYVTYANEAKTDILGVPSAMIAIHGAVSSQVAMAMADGARRKSSADLSVSVTGIAGPGGGTPSKPVGLVYIGISTATGIVSHCHHFPQTSRSVIRTHTVRAALRHALGAI